MGIPDGANRKTLTVSASGGVANPTWSPDGGRIAFVVSYESGPTELYTIDRSGSGLQRLGVRAWAAAWSPDGSKIAYLAPSNCDNDVCLLTVDVVGADGAKPTKVLDAGRCFCIELWPGLAWSPDGTQMALVIPGPGKDPYGLYVVNEDGTGLRLLREGAWGRPAWRPAP